MKWYWSYADFPELASYSPRHKKIIWLNLAQWTKEADAKSWHRFIPALIIVTFIAGISIGAFYDSSPERGGLVGWMAHQTALAVWGNCDVMKPLLLLFVLKAAPVRANRATAPSITRFVLAASICLLAAACDRRASPPANSSTVAGPTNLQGQLDRAILLSSQADLILEYRGPDMFSRHKPLPPDGKPSYVSGANALTRAIPGTNDCGRGMALLIYPSLWDIMTNAQILEEVALDLDGSLRRQGFRRIVHTVSYHGMLHERFATGLPSRAEVELKKQETVRAAEEFQRR